jgi:hypothetical protein
MSSPHVSRQWDNPIETSGPMKRQRLNRLSPAERDELNRQLEDAVELGLIRPIHIQFGSPIIFVRKAVGSLHLCIDYRDLMTLRVRTPTHFRVWMTPSTI